MIVVIGDGLLGSWFNFLYQGDSICMSHDEIDVTNYRNVHDRLKDLHPSAVLNCAGMTNHNPLSSQHMLTKVNVEGPRNIAAACGDIGTRLVHVSTDCVFNGLNGPYYETDLPSSALPYGASKHAGEVSWHPHLTVRTSFVGWPDSKGRGLLSWLHSQVEAGTSPYGFVNVLWNGFAVPKLCSLLYDLCYSKRTGVLHLFGQDVPKYKLLTTVASIYKWNIDIIPHAEVHLDRRLATVYNDNPCYSNYETFEEQVGEMKKWEVAYREFLLLYQ